MKVHLRSAGGIGGIRMEGEVDTADLPPDLARRAESVLRRDRLAGAERSGRPTPDAVSYDVRLTDDRGSAAFTVEEPCTDPEVVEVLNDMLTEVVRRKAARRRRGGS